MAELRDKNYQKNRLTFRHNVERIGEMMAFELSKTLEYKPKTIKTPLGQVDIPLVKQEDIVIATVLRAGLPFHQGFLNVFDKADNAFVRGTGEAVESVVANHLYSTLLEGGQKIELIPDIYVGEKGFTSTASLLVNGVETDVTRKYIVRNEGVVTFTAPKNNTSSPQTYSIVIASSADPNVYDTIIVTVPVPYTGNVDTVVETITNEGTTDTGANTTALNMRI